MRVLTRLAAFLHARGIAGATASAGPCSRTTSLISMPPSPAGPSAAPTSASPACSSPRSARAAGHRTCRRTR